MCYLIAKKHEAVGCFAVKATRGKALASLVSYLSLKTLDKGVQIVTVTDMDMFGGYKPYTIIPSEKEFIAKVLDM